MPTRTAGDGACLCMGPFERSEGRTMEQQRCERIAAMNQGTLRRREGKREGEKARNVFRTMVTK